MKWNRLAIGLATLSLATGGAAGGHDDDKGKGDLVTTTSTRIFQVDAIGFDTPSTAGALTICVEATARTPGYSNARLERVTTTTPADGIYAFSLVGEPPKDVVTQVLTPISLRHNWDKMPSDAKAVRVVADSNSLTAVISDSAKKCPERTAGASSESDHAPVLTGGVWLAEDIRGGGVIDNAQSTLSLDTSGKVSGSAGCNRFKGSVQISGTSLKFSPLAATRMMCAPALMNQEGKFLAALEAVRAYRLDGAFLKFLGEDGQELIRFTHLK